MHERVEIEGSADTERGFIESAVRDRTSAWGEQIESTADSLATIGKQLRSLGANPAADLAGRVAGYAKEFGAYLQEAELETLLHDAETLARQQPLAVVGASFVLGLAAARMLKVGSGRRYEAYGDQPSWQS